MCDDVNLLFQQTSLSFGRIANQTIDRQCCSAVQQCVGAVQQSDEMVQTVAGNDRLADA